MRLLFPASVLVFASLAVFACTSEAPPASSTATAPSLRVAQLGTLKEVLNTGRSHDRTRRLYVEGHDLLQLRLALVTVTGDASEEVGAYSLSQYPDSPDGNSPSGSRLKAEIEVLMQSGASFGRPELWLPAFIVRQNSEGVDGGSSGGDKCIREPVTLGADFAKTFPQSVHAMGFPDRPTRLVERPVNSAQPHGPWRDLAAGKVHVIGAWLPESATELDAKAWGSLEALQAGLVEHCPPDTVGLALVIGWADSRDTPAR